MKKLLAILLIMLYGAASTGATVQLHYCCGKLKSVKLGSAPVKECGSKHKMGSKPCCETKQISAKSQDQQDVYTISLGWKAPVEPQTYFSEIKIPVSPEAVYTHKADYSPPPLFKSLCLLNCVFRI